MSIQIHPFEMVEVKHNSVWEYERQSVYCRAGTEAQDSFTHHTTVCYPWWTARPSHLFNAVTCLVSKLPPDPNPATHNQPQPTAAHQPSSTLYDQLLIPYRFLPYSVVQYLLWPTGDGRWAPAATRWYSVSPPLYTLPYLYNGMMRRMANSSLPYASTATTLLLFACLL